MSWQGRVKTFNDGMFKVNWLFCFRSKFYTAVIVLGHFWILKKLKNFIDPFFYRERIWRRHIHFLFSDSEQKPAWLSTLNVCMSNAARRSMHFSRRSKTDIISVQTFVRLNNFMRSLLLMSWFSSVHVLSVKRLHAITPAYVRSVCAKSSRIQGLHAFKPFYV